MAFCGVVAHYLRADMTFKAVLIGMKSVVGVHSDENIAESVLQVINEYGIASKIGYLQADNAGNNDTCAEAIFRVILPTANVIHHHVTATTT